MNTIIIAEAGVNHNGDINIAKKLVDYAALSGADYIKFQSFKTNNITTSIAIKTKYQVVATGDSGNQKSMLKQLELSAQEHVELVSYCKKKSIGFLSTPFDLASLELLLELDCMDFIKVASGEITNLPLLKKVGLQPKPIILSTGMATMEEIGQAISLIESTSVFKKEIFLLHCTSEYPAPYNEINLKAMVNMGSYFKRIVGYSDHSIGFEVSLAAVALGAKVIEKHFTLDREMIGPDHSMSLTPKELSDMVKCIRNIETALGTSDKKPTKSELHNSILVRKSIVASQPIKSGETFSENNITTKRPGTGISPMLWESVIGKKANKDFLEDEIITL